MIWLLIGNSIILMFVVVFSKVKDNFQSKFIYIFCPLTLILFNTIFALKLGGII